LSSSARHSTQPSRQTGYRHTVGHENGEPIEISYLDNRNTAASHTLLLLHGLFDHKHTWDLLSPLLTHDFRIVAPDLVGFGYSSKPRFTDRSTIPPYSPDMHVEYLRIFVEELGLDNLLLVGNSLGGGIALQLLCTCPKVESQVVGLVLIDAAGYPQRLPGHIHELGGWLGTLMNCPVIRRLAFSLDLVGWSVRRTYRRVFFDKTKIPNALFKTTLEILLTPDIFYAYQQAARNIELDPQQHEQLVSKFRLIRQPTLIIWGQQDIIVPPLFARRFHNEIGHSELHLLDHCGHVPQLEQAEETARLLKSWLAQHL
jgi:pimeloyl-ACP methyl ester carboxylesterase